VTMEDAQSQSHDMQDLAGKYLTFRLDEDEFGLEIIKVREIIGMLDITSVPRAPVYIKGVINLRGRVIPVIDLRIKLEMEEIGYSERTCIIVVDTIDDGETGQVGVVVDSVSEVLNIGSDQIERSFSVDSELNTDYILGMARTENGLKILLDADKALSGLNGSYS